MTLQHPCFGRLYPKVSRWLDSRGGSELRAQLLAPLTGRVIEVGAGNGLNFAHYPASVTSVFAIEPEDVLRSEARRAARSASAPISIVNARAEQLPAQDDSFDAAVVSLVLCSIVHPGRALAELRRVVRPGGMIRFYEHVRSPKPIIGVIEDVVTPAWSVFAGGCHLNRDAPAMIQGAGFEIIELARFPFAGVTHVLGTATPRGSEVEDQPLPEAP